MVAMGATGAHPQEAAPCKLGNSSFILLRRFALLCFCWHGGPGTQIDNRCIADFRVEDEEMRTMRQHQDIDESNDGTELGEAWSQLAPLSIPPVQSSVSGRFWVAVLVPLGEPLLEKRVDCRSNWTLLHDGEWCLSDVWSVEMTQGVQHAGPQSTRCGKVLHAGHFRQDAQHCKSPGRRAWGLKLAAVDGVWNVGDLKALCLHVFTRPTVQVLTLRR